MFDQVYKAYDLVELRTVALKIHELNSQWSEEKKVISKLIHFHFCLDNLFRQITCVMQRVKAPFKKLLIIVASFDCTTSSFSGDFIDHFYSDSSARYDVFELSADCFCTVLEFCEGSDLDLVRWNHAIALFCMYLIFLSRF